ncbi:MAG: ribonucleotide reductase N-terminal alpha domain-containing protein, partial [Minisyncoccia bacterium]
MEKNKKNITTSFISKAEAEQINNSFSENALKMMKKRYLQIKPDGTQETPVEMFERVA